MSEANHQNRLDGVLIQWGDRLFYPANRMVRAQPEPRLNALAARQRAAVIRQRIEATVVRRVPQVMVKVTGGARHEGHRRALPLHQQERPPRHRGRARRDDARQGRPMRAGRRLALRWRLHRRGQRPTRGFQHHAVDAPRNRHAVGAARRAGVCPRRTGRSRVRDGAARPPGQSPCAHQRAGRVEAGHAPQPAQGGPAPLARDLRRETARLGCQGRGEPAGDSGTDPQRRSAVAHQGPGRRTTSHGQRVSQVGGASGGHVRGGGAGNVTDFAGAVHSRRRSSP